MKDQVQEAICARIAQVLAEKDIHDHFGYEALAHLKLPGPDYQAVLRALHMTLAPKLYVEIGVRDGNTLALARPDTYCIAIDPTPNPALIEQGRPNTTLAISTSDAFFANERNRERARGFDLALIDGDHDAETARRDLENLEQLAGPHSVVALHDVIPMDERTATSQAHTSFHTGDVWRLMAGTVEHRRDLAAFTVACPPTGLGIIARFGRAPWGAAPLARRPFPAEWAEQRRLLNIVSNDPQSILAAFGRAAA